MEDTPDPERRPRGRGVGEKYYSQNSNIVALSPRPCTRLGILSYRQQRSPAEFCRAIQNVLDREARLARDIGKDIPPNVIEDISAWVGRGCLP